MQPLPVLSYLLAAFALVIGTSLGWFLHWRWEHRRSTDLPTPAGATLTTLGEEKRRAVQEAEAELAALDAQLAQLQRAIAATRRQMEDSAQEHERLLLDLDAQEASRQDMRETLHAACQTLEAHRNRTDDILADISASIEEYEVLSTLNETYAARIRRLTQETQRQDSELQALRQTLNVQAAEIREAQQQVQRREAELNDLRRQCQQREAQIAEARRQLAERTEELRRLLDGQGRQAHLADGQPASQQQGRIIDVTPPRRPRLTSGSGLSSEVSLEWESSSNI